MTPISGKNQVSLLERILRLGTIGFVLILHIRGEKSDVLGERANKDVFERVKLFCDEFQRIHLHSFSGSEAMTMDGTLPQLLCQLLGEGEDFQSRASAGSASLSYAPHVARD